MAAHHHQPVKSGIAEAALKGYLFVLLAAVLWASIGVFYRGLAVYYGAPPICLAFLRCLIAGLILLISLAVFKPALLQIDRRGFALMFFFGLFGIAVFYMAYATAVQKTSLALAAILMYTAPVWVNLIAWRFLHESLTRNQILALLLASLGIVFVAQAFNPAELKVNLPGLFFGLLAGITYALYSIFVKVGVHSHSHWTVLTYGFVIGAFFLLPLQPFPLLAGLLSSKALLWALLMAIVPTLLGGLSFMYGLKFVPAGRASIVATLEPVIAALFGFFLFGEALTPSQLLGAALIIGGAIMSSKS
jgi:drug/metabolite transporter, DME family